MLSNGTFDYLYGQDSNVPIAQLDTADSDTGMLISDPSSNVRGVVEVSSGAANPWVLDNYTDYDTYGTPITSSAGMLNSGGLANDGKAGDLDSSANYGFGGGYLDSTRFNYYLSRYYNPLLAQFLSLDPLITRTHLAYSYAADNPVLYQDLNGDEVEHNTCAAITQPPNWNYSTADGFTVNAKGGMECHNFKFLEGASISAFIHWDGQPWAAQNEPVTLANAQPELGYWSLRWWASVGVIALRVTRLWIWQITALGHLPAPEWIKHTILFTTSAKLPFKPDAAAYGQ